MSEEVGARILVIDDDRGFTRLLERVLSNDGYTVQVAHTGEEGLKKIRTVNPHLLIVDVMLPRMDGFQVVQQVRSRPELSHISILMLTALGDRDSLIKGYQLGADDYLSKPFEPRDLLYRVKSLMARAEAKDKPQLALGQRSRLIVFFSGKGGVGKTTIASNLAIALFKLTRKQVALVDADFSFGDVGVHLNLSSESTIYDLVSYGSELDSEMVRQVMIPHSSGISVLLGPPRPQQGEQITAEMLDRLLPLLGELFDYVIVDGQHAYDDRMLLLLERADDIILVVTPEVGPIRNTSLFLDLAEVLEIPRERIHIILNRANSRVGIEKADIERILKHPIEHRIFSGGRAVVLSVNQGVPLASAHPDYPLSQQIFEMAEQISGVRQPV